MSFEIYSIKGASVDGLEHSICTIPISTIPISNSRSNTQYVPLPSYRALISTEIYSIKGTSVDGSVVSARTACAVSVTEILKSKLATETTVKKDYRADF